MILTVSGKSTREVLEKAEIHLKAVIEWTKFNQLVLNPSKSSFLNYSQSECEMNALNNFTYIEIILPNFSVLSLMKSLLGMKILWQHVPK